jgi:2-methylisocitrate lyase-like PEP mutase family enzyme
MCSNVTTEEGRGATHARDRSAGTEASGAYALAMPRLDTAYVAGLSLDLENGYGDDPESAPRAISRAAQAGAVGGSIEDYDGNGRLYDLGRAVERVAAAVEAARRLDFPFTLTARAENHIRGNPDLNDTLARLQASEEAGAEVLYAPALRTNGDFSQLGSKPSLDDWSAPGA